MQAPPQTTQRVRHSGDSSRAEKAANRLFYLQFRIDRPEPDGALRLRRSGGSSGMAPSANLEAVPGAADRSTAGELSRGGARRTLPAGRAGTCGRKGSIDGADQQPWPVLPARAPGPRHRAAVRLPAAARLGGARLAE